MLARSTPSVCHATVCILTQACTQCCIRTSSTLSVLCASFVAVCMLQMMMCSLHDPRVTVSKSGVLGFRESLRAGHIWLWPT